MSNKSHRFLSSLPKALEVAKVLKQHPLFPPAEWEVKKLRKTKDDKSGLLLPKLKSGERLPSVTSILAETRSEVDEHRLQAWKSRKILELGNEDLFQQYSTKMQDFSKECHDLLRYYIENDQKSPLANHSEKAENILSQFLRLRADKVTEISHCEQPVKHEDLLYCGKIDCVIQVSGLRLVADWKIPDNPDKRRLGINDCHLSEILQCVAYMGAVNHSKLFEQPLDGFALIYLYHHNETPPDAQVVLGKHCQPYWAVWVNKVKQFYAEKQT